MPTANPCFNFCGFSHLVEDPEIPWEDVPLLPKPAIAILESHFSRMTSTLVDHRISSDGETIKLLVQLQDGLQIESVVMTYDTSKRDVTGKTGSRRGTLCVSSEVGCQMGCTFCATGTMGLTADLNAGEIVEQLVHARKHARHLRNIVFMGMGEPLNNYKEVKNAISLMVHPQAFALRQQCVTLSTVGVIPRIIQLASDLPGISLALSLHAPTQELRQKIVPSARAYKLDRLMSAIDTYHETTQQKIFIEYVLLGPDINCTPKHARQLGDLLRGKSVVINVIPWNPILSPGMPFAAPNPGDTKEFLRILKEEYELPGTIRQEKGQDVGAACGQLVLQKGGRKCGSERTRTSETMMPKDVEDLIRH